MNTQTGTGGRSLSMQLKEGQTFTDMLPFERFKTCGPEALTDAELLAILIRCGTSRHTPIEIGQAILMEGRRFEGGLAGLQHLTIKELRKIDGVGEVKAIQIKCVGELSRRMARQKTRPNLDFRIPGTIADHYMERMRHEENEIVMLLSLNGKLRLLEEQVLYRGTVNRCELSPRDIFRAALRTQAVSIVLLHNHPSGDPAPSAADIDATKRIISLGKSLGIQLNDHIIIGDQKYVSFREDRVLYTY